MPAELIKGSVNSSLLLSPNVIQMLGLISQNKSENPGRHSDWNLLAHSFRLGTPPGYSPSAQGSWAPRHSGEGAGRGRTMEPRQVLDPH